MRKDIQRGLYGLALATGIFILGTSEATAAETTGEDSIAGGTQAGSELTTPVTVSDNAITLIGDPTTGSTDSTTGSTPGAAGGGTTAVTDGDNSIAGGTQITPVITAPIGIQDNAVTLISDPTTGSTDSGEAPTTSGGTSAPTPATTGEDSIGGGTQITPVITAPITVEDNAVTVIGDPTTGSTDSTTGSTPGAAGRGTTAVTDGDNSIAGGTQITPVITAPLGIQDNAATVIGDPTTGSTDGNTDGGSTGPAPVTDGEGSLSGGTQITPVITAPITVEDNAVTVIGDPTTSSGDTTSGGTGSTGTDGAGTGPGTDDNGLGVDAGAEGTVGVGGADGAVAGGARTHDGTEDAHTADELTTGAASDGTAVTADASADHRVTAASSSVSPASSAGAGLSTEEIGHRRSGATPGGVLAHTGATASMMAGMGVALMVAGAVLVLAGRRRALLR
ncbi:hypothetical protein [Kocuria sp. U4B]